MRMNNLSARLICNAWLVQHGHSAIHPDASYEEFADELRKVTASTMVQAPFASRPDAVAYIREMARTKCRTGAVS